jgi:hypothetical protein
MHSPPQGIILFFSVPAEDHITGIIFPTITMQGVKSYEEYIPYYKIKSTVVMYVHLEQFIIQTNKCTTYIY